MKAHTRIIDAWRWLLSAWMHVRRETVPTFPEIDGGDLQVTAGFGALIYGVSLVHVPAAWMLAGALLLIAWSIPRIQVTRRGKE